MFQGSKGNHRYKSHYFTIKQNSFFFRRGKSSKADKELNILIKPKDFNVLSYLSVCFGYAALS